HDRRPCEPGKTRRLSVRNAAPVFVTRSRRKSVDGDDRAAGRHDRLAPGVTSDGAFPATDTDTATNRHFWHFLAGCFARSLYPRSGPGNRPNSDRVDVSDADS